VIKFPVHNRFTGAVQFTAEIDCADDAATSVKLGLAVRWAVKTRANLAGAHLAGANLARANLAGANLAGANLADANLARANLARAYLARANLADAHLARADLAGARLAGAHLARAHLAGAYLAGADLAGADLAGAYLAGAYLARAYLADADLAGAYLADAKIKRIQARATRSDGYEFLLWRLEGGWRIIAGCRSMASTAEYRAHIAANYPDTPKAAETEAILAFFDARIAQDVEPSPATETETQP
jgi:hypothetical protein